MHVRDKEDEDEGIALMLCMPRNAPSESLASRLWGGLSGFTPEVQEPKVVHSNC